MGHATRSIPIIRILEELGHQVFLASDGRALLLLREEFPHLKSFEISTYNIKYSSNSMLWNMATQLPKITRATFGDIWHMKRLVKDLKIDCIISDNRFGCFHSKIPSYFITHQLNLDIPNPIARFFGNLANRFWMNRFQECWVPDAKRQPNISGKLSHPSPIQNVKYIGTLTRMKKIKTEKKYRLCIILSGPEPQRTQLEKILMNQIKAIEGKIIIIKGKTESKENINVSPNIEVVSFMTSKDLNQIICSSELIVSRSGYSTLMDLTVLGASALLIPTPGQTEQEYLANHFDQQGIFMMQKQENINLKIALQKIKNYKGIQIQENLELKEILSEIKNKKDA